MRVATLQPFYTQTGETVYQETLGDVANEGTSTQLNDGTIVTVVNGVVTVIFQNGVVVKNNVIKSTGLGEAKQTANALMTVGGAVSAIVPVGTIVGAVLAAAGALINAFSYSAATRKAEQQAGAYDNSNNELRTQNAQLDQKIVDLQNAIIKAKQQLGVATTNSVNGLGYCLINCAKTKAQNHLADAKSLFEELTKAQQVRLDTLQKLSDEVERLFIKQKKINYVYIGSGVAFVGALAYFLIKKLRS